MRQTRVSTVLQHRRRQPGSSDRTAVVDLPAQPRQVLRAGRVTEQVGAEFAQQRRGDRGQPEPGVGAGPAQLGVEPVPVAGADLPGHPAQQIVRVGGLFLLLAALGGRTGQFGDPFAPPAARRIRRHRPGRAPGRRRAR